MKLPGPPAFRLSSSLRDGGLRACELNGCGMAPQLQQLAILAACGSFKSAAAPPPFPPLRAAWAGYRFRLQSATANGAHASLTAASRALYAGTSLQQQEQQQH